MVPCEYTLNSLFCLRIYYELTSCITNSHPVSRIHFEFTIFFATSQSILRIYHEFTICFVNSLWIHLFCVLTLFHWFDSDLFHFQGRLEVLQGILHTIVPNSPNWLFFDKFDRSLTSDDFLWPDLTFNDIEFQSTTKLLIETYVYLGYFDQPARIDPYWTGWPKFDLWWPLLTSKNIKSESLRNVLVKTYVYWIYFD